jgi:hypothetical protein
LFTCTYGNSLVPEREWGDRFLTLTISFSPHDLHEIPFCVPNCCGSCYLEEYVGWRIEANWDYREAVDYDDYD